MLTLAILRHAKSAWDNPEMDDHERPLAPRGAKAAPVMGRRIVQEGARPDLILCSDAVRTRATLALVLPELGAPPPPVAFEAELYLATPQTLLARIRSVKPPSRTVLLIGHNPGLHMLALELVAGGGRKDLAALATGFPTAALALVTFDATAWRDVGPATGRLALFATPKDGD